MRSGFWKRGHLLKLTSFYCERAKLATSPKATRMFHLALWHKQIGNVRQALLPITASEAKANLFMPQRIDASLVSLDYWVAGLQMSV